MFVNKIFFDEVLNQEYRAFVNRATDVQKRWQSNVIVTDIYHTYYVEYYQERLYWVYDYNSKLITMIYASNPYEAVKNLEYTLGVKK
jgi:hypothetical protein